MQMEALSAARSVLFVRPSVMGFMKNNDNYHKGAEATIEQLNKGIQVKIDSILPLSQAAFAHERLEKGQTSGSLLLETNY